MFEPNSGRHTDISRRFEREKPMPIFAWILATEFFWGVGLGFFINTAVSRGKEEYAELATVLLIFTFLMARVILLFLDYRLVKKSEFDVSVLYYVAGFFVMGIFLFIRAKSIDNKYGYFILWLLPALLSVAGLFFLMTFYASY